MQRRLLAGRWKSWGLASIASVAVFTWSGPSQAQYRCVLNGKTSFQDQPCQGAGEQEKLKLAPVPPSSAVPRRTPEHETAIGQGILHGIPLKTMTMAELERTLGRPLKINTTNGALGYSDQRVYEKDGRTWYVYTDGREVTSTQSMDGTFHTPPAPVARPTRQCPSPQEIRNEETSASSITISDEARQRLRDRVARMKACTSPY